MLSCGEEAGAEVRDVRFLLRETPDVSVVDKVVTLPEGEVVGFGQEPLHLDVDAGAGLERILHAVEPDHAADAAFDAVGGDDHLRKDFLRTGLGDAPVAVAFSENDADHSSVALDFAYEFSSGASFNLGPVVGSEFCEPRVENFSVQHDARARLRNLDVHAIRAVNVKAVDNAFDAAFVNRTVSL